MALPSAEGVCVGWLCQAQGVRVGWLCQVQGVRVGWLCQAQGVRVGSLNLVGVWWCPGHLLCQVFCVACCAGSREVHVRYM